MSDKTGPKRGFDFILIVVIFILITLTFFSFLGGKIFSKTMGGVISNIGMNIVGDNYTYQDINNKLEMQVNEKMDINIKKDIIKTFLNNLSFIDINSLFSKIENNGSGEQYHLTELGNILLNNDGQDINLNGGTVTSNLKQIYNRNLQNLKIVKFIDTTYYNTDGLLDEKLKEKLKAYNDINNFQMLLTTYRKENLAENILAVLYGVTKDKFYHFEKLPNFYIAELGGLNKKLYVYPINQGVTQKYEKYIGLGTPHYIMSGNKIVGVKYDNYITTPNYQKIGNLNINYTLANYLLYQKPSYLFACVKFSDDNKVNNIHLLYVSNYISLGSVKCPIGENLLIMPKYFGPVNKLSSNLVKLFNDLLKYDIISSIGLVQTSNNVNISAYLEQIGYTYNFLKLFNYLFGNKELFSYLNDNYSLNLFNHYNIQVYTGSIDTYINKTGIAKKDWVLLIDENVDNLTGKLEDLNTNFSYYFITDIYKKTNNFSELFDYTKQTDKSNSGTGDIYEKLGKQIAILQDKTNQINTILNNTDINNLNNNIKGVGNFFNSNNVINLKPISYKGYYYGMYIKKYKIKQGNIFPYLDVYYSDLFIKNFAILSNKQEAYSFYVLLMLFFIYTFSIGNIFALAFVILLFLYIIIYSSYEKEDK